MRFALFCVLFFFPAPLLITPAPLSSLSRVGGNLELFVLLDPRVYGDDKEGDGDDKEETELSWVYWFPVFTGMTKKEMGMTLSSHSRASRFSFPRRREPRAVRVTGSPCLRG